MGKIEDLEKELNVSQQKRRDEEKIKKLQKEIQQEKFKQSKIGKGIDSVGKVFSGLENASSKKTKPKKTNKKNTTKKDPVDDINDIINRLPQ